MAGVQSWPFKYSDAGQQYPQATNWSINPCVFLTWLYLVHSLFDAFSYDDRGDLLPWVTSDVDEPLMPGSRDGKVMSYNFRLCITKNVSNKVAFVKPEGYTSSVIMRLRTSR